MLSTILLSAVLTMGPAQVEACEYEDGSSQKICVWDARHQGNGEGRSVLIFDGGTRRHTVVFISHRLAHRLTH